MNYKEIAWAAFIDKCIAGNSNKYVELFRNTNLINKLRQNPSLVPFQDFHNKVIKYFLNSWGRMYFQDVTAKEIYEAVIELNPIVRGIINDSLVKCNLNSGSIVCQATEKIYYRLTAIRGVNLVGFSKIAHILNDSLFPLIDNPIRKKYEKVYHVTKSPEGYTNWMREMQIQAGEVTKDYQKKGYTGTPELFLSQNLGYTSEGCNKSLIKFLDEYY